MGTPYRGSGLDLGNQKLTSVGAGTNPTDAVNFGQLSSAIGGTQWKNAVAAATTGSITLTGEQTIDGVTTSASRVLVKNQANAAQNGIYVTSSGQWSYAGDSNTSTNVQNGDAVSVLGGSVNGETVWNLTTLGAITPGTTAQTWAKLAYGLVYSAGRGITINAAGQVATTAPLKYAAAVPSGFTATAISHGLGTTDVQVAVYDITGASPVEVLVDITITDANTVTLGFATAPTTGQYRVVVIG